MNCRRRGVTSPCDAASATGTLSPTRLPCRHHPPELRSRARQRLARAAGAARHLGAVVRPVQDARPGAREARDRLRRPLQARQAQRRRRARDRAAAVADVRRAQHPVLRAVQGRPAGRRLRRRAARGARSASSSTSTCRAPTSMAAEERRRTRPRSCSPKATPRARSTAAGGARHQSRPTTPRATTTCAPCSTPAASTRRARPSSRSPPRPVLDAAPGRRRPLDRRAAKRRRRRARRTRWPPRSPPTSATSTPASSWRKRHFAARRFTQAMDELLEIVMRDKAWKDELARKTYVAILRAHDQAAPTPPRPPAAPKQGTLEIAGKMARGAGRSGRRRLPAQAEHGAVLIRKGRHLSAQRRRLALARSTRRNLPREAQPGAISRRISSSATWR